MGCDESNTWSKFEHNQVRCKVLSANPCQSFTKHNCALATRMICTFHSYHIKLSRPLFSVYLCVCHSLGVNWDIAQIWIQRLWRECFLVRLRIGVALGSRPPLEETPRPFGPGIPEESPKESPGACRPRGPKRVRNSLGRVSGVSKQSFLKTPETLPRLFSDIFLDPGAGRPRETLSETPRGFWARRARESPLRGGKDPKGCLWPPKSGAQITYRTKKSVTLDARLSLGEVPFCNMLNAEAVILACQRCSVRTTIASSTPTSANNSFLGLRSLLVSFRTSSANPTPQKFWWVSTQPP